MEDSLEDSKRSSTLGALHLFAHGPEQRNGAPATSRTRVPISRGPSERMAKSTPYFSHQESLETSGDEPKLSA